MAATYVHGLVNLLDGPLPVVPPHDPTTLADFFDRIASTFLILVLGVGPPSLSILVIFSVYGIGQTLIALLLGPRPEFHRLFGPLQHFCRGDRAHHVGSGLLLYDLLVG